MTSFQFALVIVTRSQVTTKPSKGGKARKRGHMMTEMNMQSDTSILIEQEANASTCAAAHQVLQLVLRSASVFIKWEHHKVTPLTF